MNDKYFNASSIRLMRFLYSLGFDKESYINEKGYENWKFKHTPELQEALDFYFKFRKKGVNENEKRKDNRNLQNYESNQ